MLSLGGKMYTATDSARVIHLLDRARRSIYKTCENYDVVLTPTLALPPPRIGELGLSRLEKIQLETLRRVPNKRLIRQAFEQIPKTAFAFTPYTLIFNVTGQPAMSVPLYWNDKGLPIGTQFIARYNEERLLFKLAKELEEARPFRRVAVS